MSERFVVGNIDTRASTILLAKAEPSSTVVEEEPLEIGSWLTLHQGDGPPRTAIRCFEPKPKRANELKEGDVILDIGSPCRVLDTPGPPGADGGTPVQVYDIFAEEVINLVIDDAEEMRLVTTWTTRYRVRDIPPAEVGPGTLVLQKLGLRTEEHPERVFELPGRGLGPSLLRLFDTAERYRMPVTLLLYEVMGKFQLVAFGVGNWDLLG